MPPTGADTINAHLFSIPKALTILRTHLSSFMALFAIIGPAFSVTPATVQMSVAPS